MRESTQKPALSRSDGLADLLEVLKQRALAELRKRDDEGAYVELNYAQKQLLKHEDVPALRRLVDRRLRRTKTILWFTGLFVPIALIIWLGFELGRPIGSGRGLLDAVYVLIDPAIWAVGSIVWAFLVSLPRMAALERAQLLLDIHAEFGGVVSGQTVESSR